MRLLNKLREQGYIQEHFKLLLINLIGRYGDLIKHNTVSLSGIRILTFWCLAIYNNTLNQSIVNKPLYYYLTWPFTELPEGFYMAFVTGVVC